ncbi:MAG TPA: hypothetical protein VJ912_03180 [Candidatus Nanoarchaeia archaeon]|nr:hypothetical protein [Candidatus Nanoarchaeia archaeon]
MGGINFKYSKAIFILFILVVGIILYTSVFNSDIGNLKITGNFFKSNNNPNESSDIKANITIDSLELEGNFKKVMFTSSSENKVKIEKLNPSINNSKIILENYDGKISLTSEKITSLEGDADKILIKDSGLSFSDKEHDVEIENFDYEDLEIEGIYIRKFDKIVSGIIDVQGVISEIKNNTLLIKKFKGDLNSKGLNGSMNFDGIAERVRMGEGDFSFSF